MTAVGDEYLAADMESNLFSNRSEFLEELMRRISLRLANLLSCVALIALFVIVGSAQFRAGLQGVVTDGAGGTVADATVTLVSKETNQSQSTQTSGEGFYRFSGLAPGQYSITVEKQNFKKRIVDNVTVNAEALNGQDITLEAGVISEVVTVQAENEGLQTEDANVSRTITSREIQQLPQPGRDPYELLRLTPGVFGTGARSADGGASNLPNTSGPGGSNNSIFQTENQVPITANGQRISSNNYQIDGTSANSQTWGGAALITPSQESVKELQVTSTTYSAEDGRNSGAQVKVITQNGTNDWHGSLFYHLNDPDFNAFNTMPASIGSIGTTGPQKVLTRYRQYGGSIGGPLPFFHFGDGGPMFDSGKDRLFFFFSFEGTKDNTNNPYISWIDTADLRSRILSARAGTTTAAFLSNSGVAPRILSNQPITFNADANRFLCGTSQLNIPGQLFPGGVDFGSVAGTYGTYPTNADSGNGFDNNPDLQCAQLDNPRSSNAQQYFTRIDFNATDKDKFAFSSFFTPSKATTADSSAQSRPMSDFTSDRLDFTVGLIYIRTFSSNITNEARFNFSGWGFNELASNPNSDFGLPRVEIEGIWGDRLRFGAPQPGVFKDRQYDYRDIFTVVTGNHVLKFGGAFRRDVNAGGEVSGARPLFSFVRPWNFANGTPVFEQITADPNGFPTANNTVYHTDDVAFFAQDDWKFKPNLTLNLGLRWEYFSPITTENGTIGNLILDSAGGLAGAKIDAEKRLTDPDWNNFGPQIGFAWAPGRFKNKMVVRGGGGIGYDRLANALLDNARRNPPGGQNFGLCCAFSNSDQAAMQMVYATSSGGIFGFPQQPNVGGGVNPTNGLPVNGAVEIYGSPRDLPNSSVYRYSLESQYELPWKTVATLGYSGSMGRNFVRIDPVNITGPSLNPNISRAFFARADVNTNYNALLASLRTRLYRGLSLGINYTYGKSLDNSSYEAPCGCTNQSFPIDQKEEYGRSDYDVRHNIVASAVWDLPFYRSQKSWEGKLIGGWQVSTIVTYNTGFPWTPRLFGCLNGITDSANNQFCDPRPTSYDGTKPLSNTNDHFLQPGGLFPGGVTNVFGTAFDSSNPFASPPGVGRNTFFGPKYFDTDISVNKRFGLPSIGFLGESAGIDLRVNFFNVFNNLNLAPFGSASDPTRVQLPAFATATTALSGRVGEIQVRLSF